MREDSRARDVIVSLPSLSFPQAKALRELFTHDVPGKRSSKFHHKLQERASVLVGLLQRWCVMV